jgi:hypothetical protein
MTKEIMKTKRKGEKQKNKKGKRNRRIKQGPKNFTSVIF